MECYRKKETEMWYVITIIVCICIYYGYKESNEKSKPKEIYASYLNKLYYKNEIYANKNYTEKNIVVIGRIHRVFDLHNNEGNMCIELDFGQCKCYFSNEHRDKLSTLYCNNEIKIYGKCIGLHDSKLIIVNSNII